MKFSLLKKSVVMAGLAVTIALLCGCSQESLIFYPETLPADYKFNFTPPYEEVSLKMDGAVIHGILFQTGKPKGVVLYFHGNAGSLRTWGDIAAEFTTRGYDLLIPDYRGFGKSTGQIKNEAMLLQDGLAMYTFLAGRYPENRIVIYGRSIGTGVATYLAQLKKPGMLILESPFFNMIDLAGHHYSLIPVSIIKSFLKYPLRNDLWIKNVVCPVYIFHGNRDDIIPENSSVRLIKVLGNRGEFIRIEGGGHNDLGDYPLYQQKLSALLK